MTSPRLSAETVHATSVASNGQAVLITGGSGSGKSDLALRLLDQGFQLISDDQTILRRRGDQLTASAPPTIAGKIEIRGIGIVEVDHADDVPLVMAVELTSEIQRMPDDSRERSFLGVAVPLISVDAMTPSAAAKVRFALDWIARR